MCVDFRKIRKIITHKKEIGHAFIVSLFTVNYTFSVMKLVKCGSIGSKPDGNSLVALSNNTR